MTFWHVEHVTSSSEISPLIFIVIPFYLFFEIMQDNSYELPLDKPICGEIRDGLSTDELKMLFESYIQRQQAFLDASPITGFMRYQREVFLMDAQLQYRLLNQAVG